jgi:hypothetical protein
MIFCQRNLRVRQKQTRLQAAVPIDIIPIEIEIVPNDPEILSEDIVSVSEPVSPKRNVVECNLNAYLKL